MSKCSQLFAIQLCVVLSLLWLCCLLPLNANASVPASSKVNSPANELWRSVRHNSASGKVTSQVKTVDSTILINPQADKWTRFRMEKLINYGLIALAGMAGLLLLLYLFVGRAKLEDGLSGRMVPRFTDYERVLHWSLALVFIFLAVSGMTLLFGRSLLIPILGQEIFSIMASASKEGHNLFGPVFLVLLILMLFRFVIRNIYARGDLTWLLKGGGLLGKSHVSGGFFNMGEKTWYWLVILVGLAIAVSGLILVSPNLGQSRVIMELSHVVHGIAAIFLIVVSLGHMYLALLGTEGTLESMKSGYVDIKWAEEHHDRWAAECHEKDTLISAEEFARLQGKVSLDSASVATAVERAQPGRNK